MNVKSPAAYAVVFRAFYTTDADTGAVVKPAVRYRRTGQATD